MIKKIFLYLGIAFILYKVVFGLSYSQEELNAIDTGSYNSFKSLTGLEGNATHYTIIYSFLDVRKTSAVYDFIPVDKKYSFPVKYWVNCNIRFDRDFCNRVLRAALRVNIKKENILIRQKIEDYKSYPAAPVLSDFKI